MKLFFITALGATVLASSVALALPAKAFDSTGNSAVPGKDAAAVRYSLQADEKATNALGAYAGQALVASLRLQRMGNKVSTKASTKSYQPNS